MPTYDYRCTACGKQHEIIQKMSDDPTTKCPSCQQHTLQQTFTRVSLQFKGSGFYNTDYNTPAAPSAGHCNKGECGCKNS